MKSNYNSNISKNKWLITGATGFVGIHLCNLIQERFGDDAIIYALARSKDRFSKKNIPGICIEGDLDSPKLLWVNELPEDLTGVIHVAGLIHSHDLEEFYKVNALGTRYLIENLKTRYANNNLKFILISSLAAFGPIGSSGPVGAYGKSKLEGEKIATEVLPKNWIYSIFRPPIVIGPKDLALYDIYSLLKSNLQIRCGKKGNDRRYHFVCVFDLVAHIVDQMQKDSGELIYPFYPQEITFGDLTQVMAKHMGKDHFFKFYIPEKIIILLSKFSRLPFFPRALSRLTPDKVQEILELGWLCPQGHNFSYNWNLDKTLEITVKDYQLYDTQSQMLKKRKKSHDEKHSCCSH